VSWVGPERKIEISDGEFYLSEIGLGFEELKNPDWMMEMSNHFEQSHRGTRRWIYLTGLQSVTTPLPPINYVGSPIRSKLNFLLKGQAGGGKGFIIHSIHSLCPNVHHLGIVTSAALVGGINKKGEWVPGEAYWARYGILTITELFQTLRSGEFYESTIFDLNEIAEYPHRISKSIVTGRISDMASTMQLYDGVEFPSFNKFTYECPLAVVAGVPEMSLRDLMTKVQEGFVSRFIEIPISYTRSEAEQGLDTWWDNVLVPTTTDESELLQKFRRCFYVLYGANFGILKDLYNVEPITDFRLPIEHRETLESETKRALKDSWNLVEESVKEEKLMSDEENPSSPPPILFRECGDIIRICVADASSRRFSGTEIDPGIIEIDDRAVKIALEYLNMIVETRVHTLIEAKRIMRFRIAIRPMLLRAEYDLLCQQGEQGMPEDSFVKAIVTVLGVRLERAKKTVEKLKSSGLVVEKEGKLIAKIYSFKPKGMWV